MEVIQAFKIDDEIVSSTLIRNCILEGDLRKATADGTPLQRGGRRRQRRGAQGEAWVRGIEPEKELLPRTVFTRPL